MLICRLLISLKINVFKKFFQVYHQSVKSLDPHPDQDQCFVGSDLSPNCLHKLLADNKNLR